MKMNLSLSQTDALLRLGESAAGHDFIEPNDLKQLLECDLVYWRKPDDLDFTPAGEQVYNTVTRTAAAKSR